MDWINLLGKGWCNVLKYVGGVISVGVVLVMFLNSVVVSCEYKIIIEWNFGFLVNICVMNDIFLIVDGWDVNWFFNGDNCVRNFWLVMIEGDNL